MKNSTYSSWSIDSSAVTRKSAEKEFELATRAARSELKREQARADSDFFKTLRNTASMDLQAISNAQANFVQALAIASENYRQALANAERLRLCATLITEVPIDSRLSSGILDPLNDVARDFAMQHATASPLGSAPPAVVPIATPLRLK